MGDTGSIKISDGMDDNDNVKMMEVDEGSALKLKKAMNQSIFRPGKKDNWLKERIRRFMVGWLKKNDYRQNRFHVIHHVVKTGIVHKILKFISWKMRKYIIKDINDIPKEWWNNHLRMFYWSFADKGLYDMWLKMFYVQGYNKFKDQYKDQQDFVDRFINAPIMGLSHGHRKLLIDIWMTEMLEDTIDREWVNMSILRLTKAMCVHYGVSETELAKIPEPGKFPVYLSITQDNPEYYFRFMDTPVWQVPKEPINAKDKVEDNGKETK
jgi:hypothetical protein